MNLNKQVTELRKFYIDALTNTGYKSKDLKEMNNEELAKKYYEELKRNIRSMANEIKM